MNIYVYSDESGVFDKEHNDYFVLAKNDMEKEISEIQNMNVIYLP